MTTGILLINLGTPDSYQPHDVKRYLIEFLTDPRVIDSPWLSRQLLVRGVIVPRRYKASAAAYKEIWTDEGSPLMVYTQRLQKLLQEEMGNEYIIEIGMRYQNPSIEKGIKKLIDQNVDKLIIFPLFPQYASATTGSVHQKCMEILKEYQVVPEVHFIEQYAAHPAFLDAFAERGAQYNLKDYDHIIFSFHGLPERQIKKADRFDVCLKPDCCQSICNKNKRCYAAQCHATARGIVERLEIKHYTLCFQSRLGKDPWLRPYASNVIEELAHKGCKKILAFCPSFVCDCLETIYEFGVEYQKEFQLHGGESLDLVTGLNDSSLWVSNLSTIIKDRHLIAQHLPL